MIIIKPSTYGRNKYETIEIVEPSHKKVYLQSDIDAEDLKDILAYIEYYQKNGIEFSVEGFRTDREKYPNE